MAATSVAPTEIGAMNVLRHFIIKMESAMIVMINGVVNVERIMIGA